MSSSLTDEQIFRLLVAQIPSLARRAVHVPVKRFGTVESDTEPGSVYLDVLVDGDTLVTTMLNATGLGLAAGQRVVVDFYPPNGAMVDGVLGSDLVPTTTPPSALSTYGQTFQMTGAVTATESDIHYVPFAWTTATLTGGVTVYGTGTVDVILKRNGVQVGSTLSITGTGMFSASIGTLWAAGDAMTVEVIDPGTGCSGLVVTEIS